MVVTWDVRGRLMVILFRSLGDVLINSLGFYLVITGSIEYQRKSPFYMFRKLGIRSPIHLS